MGLLDWLRKKRPADEDPVAAFDRRLDTLASRGGELRRAAATLLAARGQLERGAAEARRAEADVDERLGLARATGRADVVEVLERDLETARGRARHLTEALARLDSDGKALAETAVEVEREAEGLRRERATASAQLVASRSVAGALTSVEGRFDEVVRLEKARDDIERAHALAELCREDLAARRK